MERVVAGICQRLIGGDGEENIGCLHADLELVEIIVEQDAGMIESAFDHRFRAWLAIFFQQVFLQRSGIHTDPHGAVVVLRSLDDLAYPFFRTDIAGVDAQTGGAGLGGFDPAFVVEVNVGDDWHGYFRHDLLECCGTGFIRAGDPHDIGTGNFHGADLLDGSLDVMGQGVGHGLHRDRCITTDRHIADMDLAGFTAFYMAPGANGIVHGALRNRCLCQYN